MMKEEIEYQIQRCKKMQSECQLRDIETFLKLSRRIEELLLYLKQIEDNTKVNREPKQVEMF